MHTNIFTKFDKNLMKTIDLESENPARPPQVFP